MLIVRAVQILGEAHVSVRLKPTSEACGHLTRNVEVPLTYQRFDISRRIDGRDLSWMLGGWGETHAVRILEEFGGVANLL